MHRKVMGLSNEQQPRLALLNDLPHRWSRPLKLLINFILLAAKVTITGAWKTSSVSFGRLKHKKLWIMIHAKIASINNDRSNLFEWTWKPWASYIHVSLWLLVLYDLRVLPLSVYSRLWPSSPCGDPLPLHYLFFLFFPFFYLSPFLSFFPSWVL